ncbi:hypothetical protein [Frankia gtarii]|uniref:hypothetical protein n=1 Tax=Frankia gtarii TaxID=2950102 RepID=UPI0021BF4198|nr:hypothetical protein [Frankia gtarii]
MIFKALADAAVTLTHWSSCYSIELHRPPKEAGRQAVLDVLYVRWRGAVERIDGLGARDLFLDRQTCLGACPGSGGGLAGQGQLDAALGMVARRKSKTLAMPTYGTA